VDNRPDVRLCLHIKQLKVEEATMKVTIDLGTADIEMQRSDGSWEKVEHCRTRVTVDGAVLKIDMVAVLTGEPLQEAKDSVGRFQRTDTRFKILER